MPRAEKFGDLIPADHKVFSEGCESRHNHRYAVEVQDWQHSGYNPTRAKQKLLRKPGEPSEVPGADKETQSHLH